MIGYGSLLSHQSLSRTIPDKPFTPILVRGYKRLFNLAVSKGRNPDVLNVQKARGKTFNGVLFHVDEQELRRIMEREEDYNLEETHAYDFRTKRMVGKGFVCADYVVGIDRLKRLPEKKYFILCREAAYHISLPFGEYWDQTTYLADGNTVTQWIGTHPAYDTIDVSPPSRVSPNYRRLK